MTVTRRRHKPRHNKYTKRKKRIKYKLYSGGSLRKKRKRSMRKHVENLAKESFSNAFDMFLTSKSLLKKKSLIKLKLARIFREKHMIL